MATEARTLASMLHPPAPEVPQELPCKVTGYQILVRIPRLDEKTRSGLVVKPEQTRRIEEAAQEVAEVLAMGPAAYSDKEKFPTGPWCHVGDWIIMRAYSGTRFTFRKIEYRLINDDTVQAVTDYPEEIERP
jgi:co-chaperonin GroES (HSP10)